ncbi:Heterokaryon incompatibility protein (HET) domain containing protein [Hyaloscypha variabilis]
MDDEKNTDLCQDCRSLVRAVDRELGQRFLGIPQMPALNRARLINESSAHDCPVCQLFLKPFRDEKTSSTLLRDTKATSKGKRGRKHLLRCSTGSIDALNSAKAWLEDCLYSHASCHPSSEPLPSRLIDTGPGARISLRLVEKAQMSPGICYLTLSHCWGQNQMPIRLLRHNLDSFKQHIPFTELSPVFQDAIKVVKHLGYRYLWVDSLCIIQDCTEDWKIESGLMGAVYSGSTCNLAATARPDGSKSLFFDRDMSTLQPLTVQASNSRLVVHDLHFWQRSVEDSPLWRRAWVYQELLLARRNIHFGASQLFWECDDRLACESYPAFVPKTIRQVKLRSMAAAPYETWESIVSAYSKGELTYETDKLVAISGLASKVQDVVKDEYVAGLWRANLQKQLLWRTDQRYASRRPAAYVAPTWSWASVTGRVYFPNVYMDDFHPPYETFLDRLMKRDSYPHAFRATVEASPANPLGQVSGGSLHVTGCLVRVWPSLRSHGG